MLSAPSAAKEIFFAALDKPTPADRTTYLAAACGDDADLRRHVEALLAAHDEPDSRLDQPFCDVDSMPDPLSSADSSDRIGTRIGPYKLRELLGEGGMGVVYVAEQTEPVRRKVALKIIKPGMDSRQVIARFEAERQALALMDHPHIAKVLEAGTTESGRPYFVMELVCGMPITEYCDKAKLTPRQRLEIFVTVCQAVQHAHQKGIIHRDLKPSNILVTLHDSSPVVKVIDFGVAKALNQQLSDRTIYTAVSQLVGTPLYMSPEQAEMSGLDVDTRSDVYSLGVLLYELLSGQTPFDSETLRQAGFDEMRRLIREVDPPRPSQRFSTLGAAASSTVSQRRGLDDRQLRRALRSELDWIVMKCLEKDRNRRYESASALGQDIQRYLHDEPITARPASVAYRARKWVRRHPTSAIAATVSSLAIVALSLGSWYHNHHLNQSNLHLNTANYDLNNALSVSQRLEAEALEREGRLRLQLYADDVRAAWKAWDAHDTQEALQLLRRHLPQPGQADLRGFEWHYLFAHYPPPMRTLSGHADPIISADVSPDERWIASGDKGGAVKIWELATGREVKTLQYGMQEITSVRFAPDGRSLATAGVDRTIRIWNVGDWSEAACLRGHELTVTSIAWSPNSKQLASGGRDHKLKIWDVQSQRETQTLPDYADVVRCVAWSPDGRVLAAAVREDGLHLWNMSTLQSIRITQESSPRGTLAFAFSSDSKWLASAGYGGNLVVHDIASQTAVAELDAPGQVSSLGFSPDGSLLIAGMFNGGILLCDFDAKYGKLSEPRTIPIGQGKVQTVAFADRGQTLVTALGEGGVIEVRNSAQLADRHRRYRYYTECITVAPAKDRAVLMDKSGVARLVSFPPRDSLGTLPVPKGRQIKATAFFPQGDRLAVLGDWHVRLYDSATTRYLGHLESTNDFLGRLTISPDGKYIAGSAGIENPQKKYRFWIWNAESRAIIRSIESSDETVDVRLAFSPDGKILATAPRARQTILLWNVASGGQIAQLPHRNVREMAFSPDGQTLVAATEASVSIWDVAARRQVAVLRGHEGDISDLAFSPDGQTLATVDDGGTARLWHVATRQELCILTHHSLSLHWVQFRSPHQLVIGSRPDPQSPTGANDVLVFDAAPDVGRNRVVSEGAGVAAYHMEEGDTFVGIKDYPAAITAYTEGIALDPNHAGIHIRRGDAQFRLGAFEQAEIDFSAAIEKLRDDDPARTELPLVRRGFAHCRLVRFDRALADFEAAHEASPVPTLTLLAQGFNGSVATSALPDARLRDRILALVNKTEDPGGDNSLAFRRRRGTLFAQFGQLQEAWNEYEAIVAMDDVSPTDDNAALVVTLDDFHAACILTAALGNRAAYRKCCASLNAKFGPRSSPYASWCCALATDALDDYSAAIASARLALDRLPTGTFQRMTLGAVLLRAGQSEEAHQFLNAAAASDATFAGLYAKNTRYFQAISLHHQGQIEAARQHLALGDRAAKPYFERPLDWRLPLSLNLLQREATTLIGPPPTKMPKSAKKAPSADKSGKP